MKEKGKTTIIVTCGIDISVRHRLTETWKQVLHVFIETLKGGSGIRQAWVQAQIDAVSLTPLLGLV